MLTSTDLLFSILRVAIGNERQLPLILSNNEWKEVLSLLQRHALLGIGFVAIQKLPREQWPPANVTRTLTAYATQIKAKNLELNEECHEVVRRMNHDGIEAVVIKGQSNWEHYPEGLREYRCAGDIDLWAKQINDNGIPIAVQQGDAVEYEYYKGVRGIIEYARLQCRVREDKSQFKPLYYHVGYHTDKGTEVEMHYRPSFFCSPIRNMRMQRWFKEQFDVCLQNKCQLGFPVLTSSVNVIYQLVHLYRHIFEGGIGLRQLMDYYFALRVWHNDVMECKDLQSQGMWSEGLGTPVMSKTEVMAVIRSFGMAKLAAAVMYVLNEVFAMPAQLSMNDERSRMKDYPWLLCEPNEKEGKKLLGEIMLGGNFGQYDTRDAALKKGGMMKHGLWKLKRVMRLVRSYPEEAMWEPVFRVYHLFWRMIYR